MIVAFLYLYAGMIYLYLEFRYIKRNHTLSYISMFRLMYAFIYGFFPSLVLFRINYGTTSITLLYSSHTYKTGMTYIFILSVFIYIIFGVAYNSTKPSLVYRKDYPQISNGALNVATILSLLLGFLSLYIWTRAFGTVRNFINNADAIRARYSTVYNPFAFMEHFSKSLYMSFFFAFLVLIRKSGNKSNKSIAIILFIISLIGAITVTLSTDSRGAYGRLLSVLVFFYFTRNGILSVRKVLNIVFLLAFAFFVIIASESIMNWYRFGNFEGIKDFNLLSIIEIEFGYIINSQVVLIENFDRNLLSNLFINDFINSVTAWIPSRFLPFIKPTGLWDYNTGQLLIQNSSLSGQAPTDFVTASIYLFGLPGVFLLPMFFGYLLKKMETSLNRMKYNSYLSLIYCYFMYNCIWWVSHFALENTILGLFGFFFAHTIVIFSRKISALK